MTANEPSRMKPLRPDRCAMTRPWTLHTNHDAY